MILWNRIEIDPPWPEYGGCGRGANHHYPLIKKPEDIYNTIRYARFGDGAEAWTPDPAQCHLWLWSTSTYLPWAFKLMEWLGFEYKREFVWTKPQHGLGQYAFGAHEPLLLGTMGATRYPEKGVTLRSDFGGPIDHERDKHGKRIHSRKPRAILDQIDCAYPTNRGLEMFARTRRPGVRSWGNETDYTSMGQMTLLE